MNDLLKFDFPTSLGDLGIPIENITNLEMPKNSVEKMENINRIRDINNLYFQIKMKQEQKNIFEKRLKSIIDTSDIKVGIFLSLAIVFFSVIIPFFIVVFHNNLQNNQSNIKIYLIISFSFSMLSMSIYLLIQCLKK